MISLKRLCRNCGEPFDSTRSNQKYCCYECKMEAAYREKRLADKAGLPATYSAAAVDSIDKLNTVLAQHGYKMSNATLYNALRYSDRQFRDEFGVYNVPAVMQFAMDNFERFKVRTENDSGSKSERQNQEHIEEV